MSTMPFISAIILAAGASQRMGRPKQLLPVEGRPLIRRTIETVQAAPVQETIVVLGHAAHDILPLLQDISLTVVLNGAWATGLASSLQTGLLALSPRAEGALFVPADLPALTPATIAALVERFGQTGKPIVAPVCQGKRGNPVLFARSLFAELEAVRGDQGGREVIQAHPELVEVVEVDDAGTLIDLDRPEDYDALAGR